MLKALTNELLGPAGGEKLADVRMGLGFTAVVLESGSCGLASTPHPFVPGECTVFEEAGDLIGQRASRLLDPDLLSTDPGRGLALATANALLNRGGDDDPGLPDALDLDGRRVAMVGFIAPLVPILEKSCGELLVFDRRAGTGAMAEEDIESLLPACDLAIFTSQTLVNGTIERLMERAPGEVVLMGPSTPMWRGFASMGVTHLFGREVVDVPRILDIVSQGGGTRRFGRTARKIHLALGEAK